MSDITAGSQPWYHSLNRSQWNTLIASNLGWLFDGYETYALLISIGVALRQLLNPSQFSQIPVYAGTVKRPPWQMNINDVQPCHAERSEASGVFVMKRGSQT